MLNLLNYFNYRIIISLAISAILLFIIIICIYNIVKGNNINNNNIKEKQENKNFIDKLNNNEFIYSLGKKIYKEEFEKIFDRSKNPWSMSIEIFQFVRFFSLILFSIIGLVLMPLNIKISLLFFLIGILFCWYPIYYYKAIGNERESEWSKMYEFIWVLKNNLTLYDPAKAYINTKIYISERSPNNKEIIKGFDDFYKYWDSEKIDPYIEKYYPFSITREITQIVFNMNKTGDFPEDSLTSLRGFIINQQDLKVERTLSGVAGKATICSLPFLMFSVILSLMVPMLVQLIAFL